MKIKADFLTPLPLLSAVCWPHGRGMGGTMAGTLQEEVEEMTYGAEELARVPRRLQHGVTVLSRTWAVD